MAIKVRNNAVSIIPTAISSTATSITVTSGDGSLFPILGTGDYFYATLVSVTGAYEVVKVTARADNVMTVVRAQEGTSAVPFPANSRFEHRLTAGTLDDLREEGDEASDITFVPYKNISSTNVQAAIQEEIDDLEASTGAALIGFAPTVDVTSTNVQAAIAEVGTRFGAAYQNKYTGNGSTLAFTLSSTPVGENNTQVYIDGVYQSKDNYTVSGTTLTFSTAPPLNSEVEVIVFETTSIGETSADLVTYTPAGLGAVNTTVRTKLRETVSVKDFGAVGDGVTDDTLAVYRAILQGGYILFPKGTYRVVYATMNSMPESDTRARIPFVSGTTVEFEQGASITMLDNTGSDIYAVFEIISVSDITLINPTIIADADANVLTTEGAGHAIDARSVTNLKIFGGNLSKAFTDGLYINNCTNVEVVGLTCDSNGRQGCSVISGSNISIRDCTFSNSNRVAPMAGIDIEPNPTDTLLKNVYLDNIRTEGNNGAGLNVNLTGTNLEASVVINNHTDHGSAYGASFGKFNNSSTFTDGSFIRYSNGRSFNAVNCGIQMIWTDSNVLLTVDNPYVYNPNTSLGTNQRSQDVGISLHNEVTGYTGGTDLGNVELINPKIELTSGRTLTRGIYIGFDETINNIKVIDPIKVDIGSPSTVSTNNNRVLMQLKNAGTNVSFSDRYRALKMINSASTLVRNYNTGSFSVIENTYTAAPYTLNEYSNFLVAEDLTILKDSSANTITVNLPGTASFVNAAGTAVSTSATTTTPNAVLKFYRLKTGLYKVVGETGTWTIT